MQSVVISDAWPEIVGVLVIIAVMFGAKYVPELLSGMGRGLRDFMQATRDVDREVADKWSAAAEDNGQDRPRYGFKFWLIVALGVAAIYAAAVALRELLF